ncbi:LLM class flavin-dependent oxidoreductase [Nocardia otitidiscaviarum]|uniref:LLM class flavin-dependent oxidoreductase n=1 Tax=Nocardia otitidiscaviarum TaxID=1823 RepID=UPI000694B2CF
MLALTGRYGDGWYPWESMSPDEYQRRLALVHDTARAAGRDPEAIVPAAIITMLTARTPAGLRHAIVCPSSALVSAADAAFGYGVVLWLAAQLRRGAGSRPSG